MARTYSLPTTLMQYPRARTELGLEGGPSAPCERRRAEQRRSEAVGIKNSGRHRRAWFDIASRAVRLRQERALPEGTIGTSRDERANGLWYRIPTPSSPDDEPLDQPASGSPSTSTSVRWG